MDGSSTQEQKSVLSEAIDLKMALQDVLGMVREETINKEVSTIAPHSSLKLDNLRSTILDCKEITNNLVKALRLLA